MKCICCFITGLLYILSSQAQHSDFVSRGRIEYEIRYNQKRALMNQGYNSQDNDFINALPDFDIAYYNLTFSWSTSLYAAGKAASSNRPDRGSIYMQKDQGTFVAKRQFYDKFYVYTDSIKPIQWRITNETRKIAGFECRKAIGKLQDSVFVIAFYCQEILPQSGPEFFTGLPGMILGAAVPQWYTTWFATRLELANVDETTITPPSPGKSKTYKRPELSEVIFKDYKSSLSEIKITTPKGVDSTFFNSFTL